MTASLDILAIAQYIKSVLDANLSGVSVYALAPGEGPIEYPAIGIVPTTGADGGFVEYQRTFGSRGLTMTHWFLEVACDNAEPEDQYSEIFSMLGIGTERSIFDALAEFNDNSDGYTGAILTATVPTPGVGPDGGAVVSARIPITVNKSRTS